MKGSDKTNMNKVEKIEVYTPIDFNSAVITDHAIDRAIERFNLQQKSRNKVAEWIRNKLKHAEFSSVISSERYGIGRLYLNDKIAIVLDIYRDTVLTVYKLDVQKRVKDKIYNFLEAEYKRVSKLYSRKQKSYIHRIADLKVEKAILERNLLRIRKQEKYFATKAMIQAIDMRIAEMTQELCDLQTEKTELEISLAAINKGGDNNETISWKQ